jgi:hypothetical protein
MMAKLITIACERAAAERFTTEIWNDPAAGAPAMRI